MMNEDDGVMLCAKKGGVPGKAPFPRQSDTSIPSETTTVFARRTASPTVTAVLGTQVPFVGCVTSTSTSGLGTGFTAVSFT